MLLGFCLVDDSAVEIAETEVAVGGEGTHAELGGSSASLAQVALGERRTVRSDLTEQPMDVGLRIVGQEVEALALLTRLVPPVGRRVSRSKLELRGPRRSDSR